MQPLVSIGIPTYNRPKGLVNTLEYLLNQTYKNVEIIISDNCSDEKHNIEQIISGYTAKYDCIRYYRQPENFGPEKNFEFVLTKATGKYFMWAADDDEWNPKFIEELANLLEKDEQFGFAFCNYEFIFDLNYLSGVRDNWGQLSLARDLKSFEDILRLTIKEEVPADLIYGLFRREIILESFLFSKNNGLLRYFGSDKILNLVILSKTRFTLSENMLYKVHVNSESASVSMHKGITSELNYRKGLFKTVAKCKFNFFYKLKLLAIVSRAILEKYNLIFKTRLVKFMVKVNLHKYYRSIKGIFIKENHH